MVLFILKCQIADSLEQKFYKELRNENYRFVKIVMCIYRKFLVSCKDQMYAHCILFLFPFLFTCLVICKGYLSYFVHYCWHYLQAFNMCILHNFMWNYQSHFRVRPLFANSLLSIMFALLDQTSQDGVLIIGCESLFDFVNSQVGIAV